jgi:hypothetical protein
MPTRTLPRNTETGAEVAWVILSRVLKSIRNRPATWLISLWLAGWIIFAWHIFHPQSWQAVLNTIHRAISPASGLHKQSAVTWLDTVGHWAQSALFISTAAIAIYVVYALFVWRQYHSRILPAIREERFRSSCVLEVTLPTGSKADSRAAADMLGELWDLLSNLGSASRTTLGTDLPRTLTKRRSAAGTRDMEAERLAVSLEMWSSTQTDGKVGFYIWCPIAGTTETPGTPEMPGTTMRAQAQAKGAIAPGREVSRHESEGGYMVSEEIRHLVMAHYPGCRVRWVDDPLEQTLDSLAQVELSPETSLHADTRDTAGVKFHWCELSLLADSRYPIGSGITNALLPQNSRTGTGARSGSRPGSPGAGSDPLASILGMLGSEESVPLIGIQIVAAARRESALQTQQKVTRELERLRELELAEGGKALGPQHEARVIALEEKADRQGYDVAVRLVAVDASSRLPLAGRAEARLTSILRAFARYDRATGGVTQGFRVARRGSAILSRPAITGAKTQAPSRRDWLGAAARVVARWPREGVCLPRLLPFMQIGRPCVLNMAEFSAIYHFPHAGLEGVRTLRWTNYKQFPTPAFACVSPEQAARGERFVLGLLDEDMPPEPPGQTNASPQPTLPLLPPLPLLPLQPLLPLMPTPPPPSSHNILPPGQFGVGTYPEDLRRGTYVFGPMGSGKSVFLYNAIVQYMAAGRGVGLIDGKGDSYEEVLRLVPPHLEGDVLTFDPENRRRGSAGPAGRTIGINPLDGRLVKQFGAEKVESLTMSLIRKMMGSNWDQAVLMQRFMRYGITAVAQVEPRPTMLNLWRWLQDDGKGGNRYRARALDRISNRLVRDFWRSQIGGMSSQQRSSLQNVLTRVDRYINNEVRHVILQPYSTVNFQEIMDRGTIFVGRVSPRLGEDQAFLGALLMNGFLTGAFARQSILQEQRRDYLLVVDEFQNFVDTGKADVERMLSMARGYRLGLMLAHQFTEQLPKEMLSAILKNVQTWVLFGLQADDARLFAGYMGLDASDFQNLPPYHSYQQTIVGNRKTGVYSARPLPIPLPAENLGQTSANSMGHYTGSEGDSHYDLLRAVRVPDEVAKLVRGPGEEGEKARSERILGLARALYSPAEEGDDDAVAILSLLTPDDFELYRRARSRVVDREERARLLAHPSLIADKARRIERLSELRWGTPCVEVEALVRATLRDVEGEEGEEGEDEQDTPPPDDGSSDGSSRGFYGPRPA